jgi:hypothetical protein
LHKIKSIKKHVENEPFFFFWVKQKIKVVEEFGHAQQKGKIGR